MAYAYNGILALEKDEILIQDTTWINLEYILLSEVSQIWKDKYYVTPPVWET